MKELRALEQDYHSLYASSSAPHIGPAFPYVIADAVAGSSREPWRLYALFQDGALAGCLYGRRKCRKVMCVRMSVFEIGTHYVADPLLRETDREAILWRLIEAMQDDQQDCSMFVFQRLTPENHQILAQCVSRMRLPFKQAWSGYGYKIDTSMSQDEFLAGLDGKRRQELRRRQERLDRDHGCEYIREQDLGSRGDMERFETFMNLEDSGWKGLKRTSIRRRPHYEPYFRELVRSASQAGILCWYTLRIGDRQVAMNMCLRSQNTLWLPKVAYDETFAAYGPGFLLMQHMLLDCIANPEVREMNNISGAPWLKLWKPSLTHFRNITLFSRRPRSLLMYWLLCVKALADRLAGRSDRAKRARDQPFL
jgi:Acetyltransferase (GNAT) domain